MSNMTPPRVHHATRRCAGVAARRAHAAELAMSVIGFLNVLRRA
jgi:hypothetical protein